MMSGDKPTRVAVDLLDSAAVEGRRESRSAKQQLDHWARVGRSVSMHQTAARRRVEAAMTGDLPLAQLSGAERLVVNAELDAAIQSRAGSLSFGDALAAEGMTTVALDEGGALVEYRPDGSATVLAPPERAT
jgi:ParD-like antitoxin of type II bacterial toxin-antitoxin system